MKKHFSQLFRIAIYGSLITVAGYNLWQLSHELNLFKHTQKLDLVTITVKGNVKKPGIYRVPRGTTNFELLQAAGLRSTSDITQVQLTESATPLGEIDVKTRNEEVALKSTSRIEFYFGNLTVLSREGNERIVQEGLSLDEKDRVLTEENTQAEISLNAFSRVSLDSYSEMTIDKMGTTSSGANQTELFQKNGMSWYKISYSDRNEKIITFTPHTKITPSGKGADFTVATKLTETVINCIDGLILVERPDGSDPVNLIAGQSVTVFSDTRPFSITKISREMDITRNFSQLTKAKVELVMRHMPFNFLFVSPPLVYYLVSVQFDRQTIHMVSIPQHTSVSFFVQGVKTIGESYLYGGPVFMGTIVERIMNTRIPKYIVFDKDDIMRSAASIGGLSINVDAKASSALNLKQGKNNLSSEQLFMFMGSDISGTTDGRRRQEEVIRTVFEQLKSKSIILTSMLAEQITSDTETNITVNEVMTHYKNFMTRKNWEFVTHELPVIEKKEAGTIVYEPDYDKARELLTADK